MKNELLVSNRQYSEEEKMQAAYALNMCTVSVSQIIDYNDEYVLEQEYDGILNNLNLKNIPKDEALLKIITELLNTISFFKIQEKKKKSIEKKYQQKMKSAIWSAVPNLSVFVSGNPVTAVLSLATTVGSAYMNYRREKANANNELEDAMQELEITAIEQFNALKRELFTTAWRLADEYDFDDNLRLTERQIKQYNDILMDNDELRRYARMEAISDQFGAYPPFWYFFGHTAHRIALTCEEEVKLSYLLKAKEHFEKYDKLNMFSILREDQMTASFALEYIDLLLLSGEKDTKILKRLVNTAFEKARNNNDLLQLCVITCLQLGLFDEAKKNMSILVNEGYNAVMNAQLLSALYVKERDLINYRVLTMRVPQKYLYPMPAVQNADVDELYRIFETQQKQILKEKFKQSLQRIIDKYSEEINWEISVFDLEAEYSDSFFCNTKQAKRERLTCIRLVYNDETKRDYYLERLHNVNLPLQYILIFQKMFEKMFTTNCFCDAVLQEEIVRITTNAIIQRKDTINNIQSHIDSGSFGVREYEQLQKIGIISFVQDAFAMLYQIATQQIDESPMDNLMGIEGSLIRLCMQMEIEEPEILVDGEKLEIDAFGGTKELFDIGLFGSSAIISKQNADYVKNMIAYIREKMKSISIIESEISLNYRGEIGFERYFHNAIFENYGSLKANSLLVIEDKSKNRFDLIFTTEGIVYVIRDRVRKKTPYNEIRYVKDTLDLWGKKYRNTNIDLGGLYDMIIGLDRKFVNDLDQKVVYLDGMVTKAILDSWFVNNHEAMQESVTRVYAWPNQELMEQMGYCLSDNYDREHHLLQFYFDDESGNILNLRVLEFDMIDTSFASMLTKAGGILRIEI